MSVAGTTPITEAGICAAVHAAGIVRDAADGLVTWTPFHDTGKYGLRPKQRVSVRTLEQMPLELIRACVKGRSGNELYALLQPIAEYSTQAGVWAWLGSFNNHDLDILLAHNPATTDTVMEDAVARMANRGDEITEEILQRCVTACYDLGEYWPTELYINAVLSYGVREEWHGAEPHEGTDTQRVPRPVTLAKVLPKTVRRVLEVLLEDPSRQQRGPWVVGHDRSGYLRAVEELDPGDAYPELRLALFGWVTAHAYRVGLNMPAGVLESTVDILRRAVTLCAWESENAFAQFEMMQARLQERTVVTPEQLDTHLYDIAAVFLQSVGEWDAASRRMGSMDTLRELVNISDSHSKSGVLDQVLQAWGHGNALCGPWREHNEHLLLFLATSPYFTLDRLGGWVAGWAIKDWEALLDIAKTAGLSAAVLFPYLPRTSLCNDVPAGEEYSHAVMQELVEWAERMPLPDNAARAAATHAAHVDAKRLLEMLRGASLPAVARLCDADQTTYQLVGTHMYQAQQAGGLDWISLAAITDSWEASWGVLLEFISYRGDLPELPMIEVHASTQLG